MPEPSEILANPLTFYLAVVGTTMPAVGDDPSGFDPAWEILGKEGDGNYGDSGVTQSQGETVYDFTPAGRTMPVKRFRITEQLMFKVDLVDWRPAAVGKVMNDNPVTAAGGHDRVSLYRGDVVASFAVLARGLSPLDNTLNCQFEIPKAFVSVNGDTAWNKGAVAALPTEILAVVHTRPDDEPIYDCAGTES